MLLIATTIIFTAFLLWYLNPDPMPINGVYSQPGKMFWLKYKLMSFVIGHRQKKTKQSTAKKDDLLHSQFGGTGRRDIKDMEKKIKLPDGKEWAADAIFFNASNSDKWYFTLGLAQRPNNIINLFFILRVPGEGVFVNKDLIYDTNAKSLESSAEWCTENGFKVRCVEPMKKWKISFNGNLAKNPGLKIFSENGAEQRLPDSAILASFELLWESFGEHFDFDTDVSPKAIARSLAREPWNRELFDRLKASHQTHYEQFGELHGNFMIAKTEFVNIKMTSMRDHTITTYRRWKDIRRYIMIIYHLDDGTCIHTSLVSMPGVVFSCLEFGYVVTPDKQNHAVDEIKISLPNIGETKEFPTNFAYSFSAGKLNYDVKVHLLDTVSFKMGLEQACQVNENLAEFTVNGIHGQGFVEVEYRISPY